MQSAKRWLFALCLAFGISMGCWLVRQGIVPTYEACAVVEIRDFPDFLRMADTIGILKRAAKSKGSEVMLSESSTPFYFPKSVYEFQGWFHDLFSHLRNGSRLYDFKVRSPVATQALDSTIAAYRFSQQEVLSLQRQHNDRQWKQMTEAERAYCIAIRKVEISCFPPIPIKVWSSPKNAQRVLWWPWPRDWALIFLGTVVLTSMFQLTALGTRTRFPDDPTRQKLGLVN